MSAVAKQLEVGGNEVNLCTFDPALWTVSGWCISDLPGSSAGCDISSPSSLTIDKYLTRKPTNQNTGHKIIIMNLNVKMVEKKEVKPEK